MYDVSGSHGRDRMVVGLSTTSQCTADCKPNCTMTWSGPNLPAGTRSVLNLQNISRNQTGDYQCTASNDVSSKTSVVVNVVVNCKY
jgi:hypothetical protein